MSRSLINKFGLEGRPRTRSSSSSRRPQGATSSLSVFSAFLLVISGVSFTRRIQKMYRSAWDEPAAGVRSNLFAAFGLLALLAEILVLAGVRSLVRQLPWDWLWMLPITATTGLVLWTSIPYLLLNRRIHWRRLLLGAAVSAVGTSVFGVATTIYMPPLVTKYTNEFGLFGITIALIGWLLAACGVLVASAAIGAEFDASREPWVVSLKTGYGLFDPAAGVPTVDERAAASGLNSGDLLILFRVLVNWLILAAAVWAATAIVPGISVPGGFLTLLVVSLLLGLVNAVLGPLLHLVALPLTVLTLGTFALVVNGVLLAVTAGISDQLDADGLGSCILGALVISVVTTVLELVLRPVVQVGRDPRTR